MSKTGEAPVSYETACDRVRAGMTHRGARLSFLANMVWPNHRMKPQGAAIAVSPYAQRMQKDGVIRWSRSRDGYVKGPK